MMLQAPVANTVGDTTEDASDLSQSQETRSIANFKRRRPLFAILKALLSQVFGGMKPLVVDNASVLMVEPQDPPGSTAPWYNIPWTIITKNGSQSIKTKVDTGSHHSLISNRLAKQLGLKRFLLPKAVDLGGYAGGHERIIKFVEVELECPLIGLWQVKGNVYVSKHIDGLLIGTKMIDDFEIDRKIVEAKTQHGALPPGVSAEFVADNNVIHPIFDDRTKCKKFSASKNAGHLADKVTAIKKRDKEIRDQGAGDRNWAISSLMHAKQGARPSTAAWSTTASSVTASQSSRATTWDSNLSTGSTFSAAHVDSTAATSVTTPSVFGDTNVKK